MGFEFKVIICAVLVEVVYRLNDLLVEVVNGVVEIGDPLDLSHGG